MVSEVFLSMWVFQKKRRFFVYFRCVYADKISQQIQNCYSIQTKDKSQYDLCEGNRDNRINTRVRAEKDGFRFISSFGVFVVGKGGSKMK